MVTQKTSKQTSMSLVALQMPKIFDCDISDEACSVSLWALHVHRPEGLMGAVREVSVLKNLI